MPSRPAAPWLVVTVILVALAAAGCAGRPAVPEQAPAAFTPGAPDTAPAPTAPAAPPRPAKPAPLAWAAVAKTDVTAWSAPNQQRPLALFPSRQTSRERTTFLVSPPAGAAATAQAQGWLRVLLPRRPNGSTGWIQRQQVELVPLRHRVEVDLSSRQLTLFELDRVVRRWTVAIGRPSTPTPTGRFYITVKLKPPVISRVYGAFALGLSGYSNVLDQFGTGDGQIALHGTANSASIGRAASAGCVRLDNQAVTTLAETLPLGTPVTIKR